jgi:hypothetical protein
MNELKPSQASTRLCISNVSGFKNINVIQLRNYCLVKRDARICKRKRYFFPDSRGKVVTK